MPRLQIKDITLKNFRSFGDTEVTIQLSGIGSVLILGKVDNDPTKTNGAGKSTIPDAMIWCLFGKLPSKDRPAGHVVNFITGKNCYVTLTTLDGYKITRTRDVDGHDDLLIHTPDGQDISDSTNKNAQIHLNKLFNLDYDIFMSNVFFGQFSKPFLELPDQKRKKALERMLNLTKYDAYAVVAKQKILLMEQKQNKEIGRKEQIEQQILQITQQIERNVDKREEYEAQRLNRIKDVEYKISSLDGEYQDKVNSFNKQIENCQRELSIIKTYDFIKLTNDWEIYNNGLKQLEETKKKLDILKERLRQYEQDKLILESKTKQDHSKEIQKIEIKIRELQSKNINIEQLKTDWDKFETSKKLRTEIESKLRIIENDTVKIQSEVELLNRDVSGWKHKAGTHCPTCKQIIDPDHIHGLINPNEAILVKLNKLLEQKKDLLEKVTTKLASLVHVIPEITVQEAVSIENNINELTELLEHLKSENTVDNTTTINKLQKDINILRNAYDDRSMIHADQTAIVAAQKPDISMTEAEALKQQYNSKLGEIKALENSLVMILGEKEKVRKSLYSNIEIIKSEINPFETMINNAKLALDSIKAERDKNIETIEKINKLINHIDYIKLAYSDRRKIKAYVLSKLIPFFNERIAYYLDTFGCNYTLEFNSFLQNKSSKWPYELWSGGERKRIDLAVMFAIHDLHESIHEKQCNILVFDEVDGRLDPDGVNAFVNLLFKDFSKEDAILVISHKNEMLDAFPTKMLIHKVNDISQIEEVR